MRSGRAGHEFWAVVQKMHNFSLRTETALLTWTLLTGSSNQFDLSFSHLQLLISSRFPVFPSMNWSPTEVVSSERCSQILIIMVFTQFQAPKNCKQWPTEGSWVTCFMCHWPLKYFNSPTAEFLVCCGQSVKLPPEVLHYSGNEVTITKCHWSKRWKVLTWVESGFCPATLHQRLISSHLISTEHHFSLSTSADNWMIFTVGINLKNVYVKIIPDLAPRWDLNQNVLSECNT